jgi:hypothetical protein
LSNQFISSRKPTTPLPLLIIYQIAKVRLAKSYNTLYLNAILSKQLKRTGKNYIKKGEKMVKKCGNK